MTQYERFDPAALPGSAEIDWEDLKDGDDFGRASFELLKEAVFTIIPLAEISTGTPFGRNEAILHACLLRMGLLGRSLLSDIAHNDGYQQNQILRQAFEVASNFLYLTGDDESGERFDAFINDQLAEEKNNLDLIATQVRRRGDEPWPIEDRMRRSMERMASAAGVSLDDVPRKRESGWPNSFERFKVLGPGAYVAYRAGSSTLHGGWSTLLIQELDETDGGFVLSGRGSPSDARSLLALVATLVMVADFHLHESCGKEEQEIFQARFNDIGDRRERLDELHETWFQS